MGGWLAYVSRKHILNVAAMWAIGLVICGAVFWGLWDWMFIDHSGRFQAKQSTGLFDGTRGVIEGLFRFSATWLIAFLVGLLSMLSFRAWCIRHS